MSGVTPTEQFNRIAELLVTPPVDTSGADSPNRRNARDIGFVSGNPAKVPEAGSIWYVTNTALYEKVGVSATQDVIDASLNVASVEADEQQNLVQIGVESPYEAHASRFNSFNPRTGLLEESFVINDGVFHLDFNVDGTQFFGAMDFRGVSRTDGANAHSRLQATMLGVVD